MGVKGSRVLKVRTSWSVEKKWHYEENTEDFLFCGHWQPSDQWCFSSSITLTYNELKQPPPSLLPSLCGGIHLSATKRGNKGELGLQSIRVYAAGFAPLASSVCHRGVLPYINQAPW